VEKDRFPTVEEGRTIVVTVSIGLAERGRDVEPDGLFRRADRALYRAKANGRNRVSAEAA
jgi:two-component system cell cycle response regulator